MSVFQLYDTHQQLSDIRLTFGDGDKDLSRKRQPAKQRYYGCPVFVFSCKAGEDKGADLAARETGTDVFRAADGVRAEGQVMIPSGDGL